MESRLNELKQVHQHIENQCEYIRNCLERLLRKSERVQHLLSQFDIKSFLSVYSLHHKRLCLIRNKLMQDSCEYDLLFMELNKPVELEPTNYFEVDNTDSMSVSSVDLCYSLDCLSIDSNETCDSNLLKNECKEDNENVIESQIEESNYVPDTNYDNANESNQSTTKCDNSTVEKDNIATNSSIKSNLLTTDGILKKVYERRSKPVPNYMIPNLEPTIVLEPRKKTASNISKIKFKDMSQAEQNNLKTDSQKGNQGTTSKKTGNNTQNKSEIENTGFKVEVKPPPKPNINDNCCVSSILSPDEFYIQIMNDDVVCINYMSEQILETLEILDKYDTKSDAMKNICQYCVCFIDAEQKWFRAEILSWLPDSDDCVLIILCDYGSINVVSLSNIRKPLQHFFYLPFFAIRCKLAWVLPANNATEWSLESIEYFKNCFANNPVVNICYTDTSREVAVVDFNWDGRKSLAGDMILNGTALCENREAYATWFSSILHTETFTNGWYSNI